MNPIITESKLPLLRFGVVADVQYADNDDKQAWYNPTKTRFYRNSLKQVTKAFEYWESIGRSDGDCPIGFILQLGDIIDALSKSICSRSAIDRTLGCFLNNAKMPTFHTVGNHELYNFNRSELCHLFDEYLFHHGVHESLNVSHPNVNGIDTKTLYYRFKPRPGIKFISLDTYDISVLGYDQNHPKYQLASNVLRSYHHCDDWNVWDSDKDLNDADKRFQSSNGALSPEQLQWLDAELTESDLMNEMVIVFGHVGLHPESCGWDSILWNYDQVIDCFNRHESVVAYFNGHAHNCGYAYDGNVHYIVLHGIIETPPDIEAFTTVTIHDDHMLIDGMGVERKILASYHKTFAFDPVVTDYNIQNHLIRMPITVGLDEYHTEMDIPNTIKIKV